MIACGAMTPRAAGRGDRRHQGAHRQAVRRQPDHHASAADRADRRLRRSTRSAISCWPAACRRARRSRRSRRAGAKVICFAPALALAKKLVRSGADALVIEGIGGRRPYRPGLDSACWRRRSCRDVAEVPVFVAGGIGRGEAIAAYLEMGAAGVQLGTRFVCADRIDRASGISRRPSSAPRRAMPSPACRSTRAFR